MRTSEDECRRVRPMQAASRAAVESYLPVSSLGNFLKSESTAKTIAALDPAAIHHCPRSRSTCRKALDVSSVHFAPRYNLRSAHYSDRLDACPYSHAGSMKLKYGCGRMLSGKGYRSLSSRGNNSAYRYLGSTVIWTSRSLVKSTSNITGLWAESEANPAQVARQIHRQRRRRA